MLIKGRWLIIQIKVKGFSLWLPLSLCVLKELLWQVMELTDLVGIFGKKKLREIKNMMPSVMIALDGLGEVGRYDLAEIEAVGDDGNMVGIIIKVR